jgi:hypothetical protein
MEIALEGGTLSGGDHAARRIVRGLLPESDGADPDPDGNRLRAAAKALRKQGVAAKLVHRDTPKGVKGRVY